MTPQEAIKTIKVAISEVEWDYPMDYTVAFEEAIETLEKQVPKKPKHIGEIDENGNAEVECDCFASQDVAIKTIKRAYCWRCGQLLNWEEEDV